MAVDTVKSTQITNRDATPAVLNTGSLTGSAHLQETIGFGSITAGASIASTYRLVEVPSNARISQILLSCAAHSSGTTDVGVYKSTKDGGAVVNASFFTAATSLVSVKNNSDCQDQTNDTLDKHEMPLWQRLGVSADPRTTYDIVLTLTAVVTTAGKVSLKVRYAV